jgi:DNA helicase IV
MSLRLPRWESLSKDEQVPIINLPLDQDLWTTGGPGTGKTVMALYRASQALAAMKRSGSSNRVVFMIYNKSLRKYLEKALVETDINDAVATTWHSWLGKTYRRLTNQSYPTVRPYQPDWDVVAPPLHEFYDLHGPEIDHLFLDETQDLPQPLLEILRRAARVISTFSDPNQRIHDHAAEHAAIGIALRVATRRWRLTRNYRNSLQIASVAALFRDPSQPEAPKPPTRIGQKPEAIEADDLSQALEYVARYADNQPELHVGLLVPNYELHDAIADQLKSLLKRAELQVYYNDNEEFTFAIPGVMLLTYDTAKGLEFDTVFLPLVGAEHGLETPTDVDRNRLFVACTRARNELNFLYTPATHSWAIEALAQNQELVDWYTLRDSESSPDSGDLSF